MLIIGYLQWWYGPGWRDSATRLRDKLRRTYLTFSVPILLRTLFAPWRRIISASSGSLTDQMHSLLDNVVSRAVGFGVRLCALIAAGLIMFCTFLIGGLILVAWPVLPLLGPALIVAGLI